MKGRAAEGQVIDARHEEVALNFTNPKPKRDERGRCNDLSW